MKLSPERESDPRPLSYQESVPPLNYLGSERRYDTLDWEKFEELTAECERHVIPTKKLSG